MIGYISVPYSYKNYHSVQKAASEATKQAGLLQQASPPGTVMVSGILSWYNNPELDYPKIERDVYAFSKPLVDAADILVVVRMPGWEYSDIVSQETAYAHHLHKPISYIDP